MKHRIHHKIMEHKSLGCFVWALCMTVAIIAVGVCAYILTLWATNFAGIKYGLAADPSTTILAAGIIAGATILGVVNLGTTCECESGKCE